MWRSTALDTEIFAQGQGYYDYTEKIVFVEDYPIGVTQAKVTIYGKGVNMDTPGWTGVLISDASLQVCDRN